MNTAVALIGLLNTMSAVLLLRMPEAAARVVGLLNVACLGWDLMVLGRALA